MVDQRGGDAVAEEDPRQDLGARRAVGLDEQVPLAGGGRRRGIPRRDHHRVSQQPDQLPLFREGRAGEQHRLAPVRDLGEDELDVLDEVGPGIGGRFLHDDRLQAVQPDAAAADVVDDPLRRPDHDVRALFQASLLTPRILDLTQRHELRARPARRGRAARTPRDLGHLFRGRNEDERAKGGPAPRRPRTRVTRNPTVVPAPGHPSAATSLPRRRYGMSFSWKGRQGGNPASPENLENFVL